MVVPALPVDFEQAVSRRARPTPPGRRCVRPIVAPRRFDLVGFRWRGGGEPGCGSRVRDPRTLEPSWVRVGGADAAPGQFGARSGPGTPTPTSCARRRTLPGLRAYFVKVGRPRRFRAPARAAASGQPPIIPRAAWGADQCPPRAAPRATAGSTSAFVHHTVNANNYTPQESRRPSCWPSAAITATRNGWDDIGYNFLVDRYGQVFEGRAAGSTEPSMGAHAHGYNSVSTGVAMIGSYSASPPPAAALRSLERVLAWKLSLAGVPARGACWNARRA